MLAPDGRLVSVGRLGPVVGEIDLDELARKRLSVIGVSFRLRTLDQYGECVRRAGEALLPALGDGRLRPVVDSVFPLDQVEQAQRRMQANQHLGKIVLTVGGAT
jgi:NADPH:quinone reductase